MADALKWSTDNVAHSSNWQVIQVSEYADFNPITFAPKKYHHSPSIIRVCTKCCKQICILTHLSQAVYAETRRKKRNIKSLHSRASLVMIIRQQQRRSEAALLELWSESIAALKKKMMHCRRSR